jgi:hypothetical protein
MTKINLFLLYISFFLLISCSPWSKDAYMKDYKSFIDDVSQKSQGYSDEDWKEADNKFKQFDSEWYEKFKDEMSLTEKGTTSFYNLQYVFYRNKEGARTMFDTYMKKDLEELKKKIKFYKENQMEDDLKKLEILSREAGDSVFSLFNQALRELK